MLGLGPFSLVATFLSSCEISNLYSIELHYANWKLGVTLLSVLWHGVYDIYRSTLYTVVVRETTHDGHCQALTLLCFNLQACRGDRVRKVDRHTKTIGRIDREQIRSRINNNDCRTFRPRRPLSTAYRTVLYAVDKGLRGRNVLQSLLLILLRICSRSIRPIST